MTLSNLRVFARNCVYMAQDLKSCLFPAQLVDVVRGRDFDASGRAADQLADAEAEEEVSEGRVNIAEVIAERGVQYATDLLLQYARDVSAAWVKSSIGERPQSSVPVSTTGAGTELNRLAASAPNPHSDVAGVGPAAGSSPRPAAGLPNELVELIAEVLAEHRLHRDNDPLLHPFNWVCCADGGIHDTFRNQTEWRAHVAPLIAERLESAALDQYQDASLSIHKFRSTQK